MIQSRSYRVLGLAARFCVAVAALSWGAANAAHAAEGKVEDKREEESGEEVELEPTTFGVGFQSSWPSFGLSGMMDLDERLAIQGVIGAFGRVSMFAGRGLYRFSLEELWSVYGYGSAGVVSFEFLRERETTLGLGGGVGIEYDWRAWSRKLPPIRWNLELGLAYADLEFYDYTGFAIGAGVHYRL